MLVKVWWVRSVLLIMALVGRGAWSRVGHLVAGKINGWRVVGRGPRVWIEFFVRPQAVGGGLIRRG